jgi:UDP-GlcNAc:undecaprenyl-phosphate/decaprenyl-phosphate GlcNAc-1-phosphate transferase
MRVFLFALVVAAVATPAMAAVAHRTGVTDKPGYLKIQDRPVAYLGGVAVALGLSVGVLDRPRLAIPLAMALLLGLADDVFGLKATHRLRVELVIGAVAGFVAPAATQPVGGIVTAIAVVALINAVNLLDGLDGLAAGTACISAVAFAAFGSGAHDIGLALGGSLLGFLLWNRPPARIYLGDAGSYLVGTTLALSACLALDQRGTIKLWAIAPLLVAVPVTDTLVAILRRRRSGQPLFHGDRSHVYDQLVDRGLTRPRATLCCVAAQAVLAGAGVIAFELGSVAATFVAVAIIVGVAGGVVAFGFLTPALPPPDPTEPA